MNFNGKKLLNFFYAFKHGKDEDLVAESEELLAKGVAVLDIYFETLNIRVASEVVSDLLTSLVSDVGGQMGLWIGMSMLTLMEIVWCFGNVFRRMCCGR